MSIHQLIREGRNQLKMSQQAFAEAAGVSRGAVEQWERGRSAPRRSIQPRVAELLGISLGEFIASGVRADPKSTAAHSRVPLLGEKEAANYLAIDNFRDLDGHETIPVAVPVRRHTFAMRVRGDSMISEVGDSFPDGSIIVVEPEIEARPGDYVVTVREDDPPTLKQLVRDEILYLKPLNARYPIRPVDGAAIVGVVRQLTKLFR